MQGRLILVRHAESRGNADRVMQGGGEYPLSDAGIAHAVRARSAMHALGAGFVVASDLSRAVDSARLSFGRVDRIDPRLRERGAGRFEGMTRAEFEAAYPGALENDAARPEGFEPVEDVVERMCSTSIELLERGDTVVAFTHGGVLRHLERALGGEGGRFAHLEGLEIGHGLQLLGRWRAATGDAS